MFNLLQYFYSKSLEAIATDIEAFKGDILSQMMFNQLSRYEQEYM